MNADDRNYSREALDLARQGRALASPNPMVGAVVCDASGAVVGRGSYSWAGTKHAEVLALAEAGERARGGVLYVSLEPCCFEGRTPPCVDAIISAGIRRVVCPLEDQHPKVSGAGFARLREAGVAVVAADEFSAEAKRLNEAFFHYSKTGRPLVTLKAAVTLDGKIAAPDDNSGWITSEVARAHVQQVRHDHDAILTGIGTVLADDPLLTDRSGLPRRRPLLRVVADSLLRVSTESKMVKSFQNDLMIAATTAASPRQMAAFAERGIPVQAFDAPLGRVDLPAIVDWLGKQHMISLLVEAGSKLNWGVLDAGIVDKVLLYYAPKILGGFDSLPLAGGVGRRSRSGAIRLHGLTTFPVSQDEFVVEAYVDS
ncbi:MAG: bifunctional diaminohydroxyphosphoribosylaminopyrimidine deaminase/5-amino-6-(5-phosphoribosylamino)uracil reductase RibD [Acidobacteria bacterium]|nr:bifunctional diaminohydroxyphosphoribosylaminopyrimidine deaminase/5-amino-6-(5-phosphoribosylamino)uracil reductase RibD [Acidobacteriota bacterium]